MKIYRFIILVLLFGLVWVVTNIPTLAQSYTLIGRPVSSAQAISGGNFILSGSVGQPEAGTTPLSGGDFTLNGGTKFEGVPPQKDLFIYIPIILRN